MDREQPTRRRRVRLGLQIKSGMILAAIVVGVTLAGALYYYRAVSGLVVGKDEVHAEQLARALSVAAETHLPERRYKSLDVLLGELIQDQAVVYVSIVDRNGDIVSSAWRGKTAEDWPAQTTHPVEARISQQVDAEHILVARPVVAREEVWFENRLAGAVRIVLDTSGTAASLAQAKMRVMVTAALITLCGLATGVIMVWQFMVRPIRELLGVTRRLARGDYSARSDNNRSDETGELAAAFDDMADCVSTMRQQLIAHNEQLEQDVASRTGELQRANSRLTQEMNDKEEFLRAVSHDLNAPLRNIAGMTTMIMMKWKDELPEDALARLQRIQSNVETECELLTELLELSRIRTRPEKRDVVDTGELAREVGRQLEFELDRRCIELTVDPAMPSLYVTRNRMRQVFQNLVDNAIKYMHRPRGGRIDIEYQSTPEGHLFCVGDNGPGIPEDQQHRIFQVFRRGHGANETHATGKGVGLAVVRAVASTYHGRAWLESQAGQGARFYFVLAREATAVPETHAEASHVE